jgi:flagellar FliL protein
MATNRLEQPKPEDSQKSAGEAKPAQDPVKSGRGSWMPLVLNIVLMPAIAYGLTTFVLLPKIQGGKPAQAAHGESESAHGGESSKIKHTAPLEGKVLVNVAGTAGTRYLVANMTIVGKSADIKERVQENDAQLRDVAASILGIKTISDLEKPGMRNIIRAELISAFSDILGKGSVADIYLTEFAIQ